MTSTLRALLDQQNPEPLLIPSVYDGISTRVAIDLGFEALYIGSYATGSTKYGIPDIGYINVDDMADQVRRLGALSDLPVVVDGEGGWGNPLHVARSVKILEKAGASAIHIEDHEFGKHLSASPRLISVDDMAGKLQAALDARASEDVIIIARTDATGDPAVERALQYQELGADALLIAGPLDEDQYASFMAQATVPVFALDSPGSSMVRDRQPSASAIIFWEPSHIAAEAAIRSALHTVRETGTTRSIPEVTDYVAFDRFLGVGPAIEDARRYGLID
ncbi:oxaloacetate decarboxylase [Microbacterium laevaniformans]|uniref:isocitrate lyase/PEP mutase family protein n=1 Tax=Microbacterium laevaniformans TaxID=36807 RepID=UPI003628FE74